MTLTLLRFLKRIISSLKSYQHPPPSPTLIQTSKSHSLHRSMLTQLYPYSWKRTNNFQQKSDESFRHFTISTRQYSQSNLKDTMVQVARSKQPLTWDQQNLPNEKGRVPQYVREKLAELQNKCDELERLGVLQRPEDINIVPEYLNPSFLVKKPSGGFRLVTSFGEVAQYSKPPPTLMPDVNTTLQSIG